ncbi:hypothetical protein [Megamonas funiformis]|uniref:hypothetical protein n=1 Tax=Megamonas funiformis TaxID=437897 RepID=UPI004024B509
MGENTNTGMSGWGLIIFLILLFMFMGGGFGNFFGNRGNCCGATPCEVEKQEIIDSARTQYLIEQTARQTQEMTNAGISALGNKIDYYQIQGLRDKLAEANNKNLQLENRIYSDNKFNALERANEGMFTALDQKISQLACNIPQRPPYWSAGFINCGTPIPPGYAYNTNNCNSCTNC